jgi:hypothetical protein
MMPIYAQKLDINNEHVHFLSKYEHVVDICPFSGVASPMKIRLVLILGRSDDHKKDEIYIYPNPNNGQFNIKANFSEMHDHIQIEVIDLSGVTIKRKQHNQVQLLDDVIDISGTAQGVYIIRFVLENGKVLNKKVVKL